MNIHYFEGAAGTGKTFNLIITLKDKLLENPLSEHQKVLALTFMHGSRRRLEQKLTEIQEIRRKFSCLTFDSFAWEIIQRWSSLLCNIDNTDYRNKSKYEKTCLQASKLLEKSVVQKWVSNTYPIIIIDEVQDLTESRFGILKGIAERSTMLVAGDEFQNLDDTNDSSGYLTWLKANSIYQVLNVPYRTNDEGLLNVANALRNGNGIIDLLEENTHSRDLGNFKLLSKPSWQLMAWALGFRIFQLSKEEVTVLTLANSEKIVEDAIQRVKNEKQVLNKKRGLKFGPYTNLRRNKKDEDFADELTSLVCDSDGDILVDDLLSNSEKIEDTGIKDIFQKWLCRRKKIGYSEFKVLEIKEVVLNLVRNRRVYRRTNHIKRQVLTIHQAKNREFDNVIILWSFGLASGVSDDYKRKLLYNAITRAKNSCTVIVLQENRINQPPFSS